MPGLILLERGLGATATSSQRPLLVYCNGNDITKAVPYDSISIEQTGGLATAQAVFNVIDTTVTLSWLAIVVDGAEVRFYDARLDRWVYGGFVQSRIVDASGPDTIIQVTCVDYGVLLDRNLVVSDSRTNTTAETDEGRLHYLLGAYGVGLSSDRSLVQTVAINSGVLGSAETFTNMSLRIATENVIAIQQGLFGSVFQFQYFVDALGRYVYNGNLLNPAPGLCLVGPYLDGSTYATVITGTTGIKHYYPCNDAQPVSVASGATLADSVGSVAFNDGAAGAALGTPLLAALAQAQPWGRVGPIPALATNNAYALNPPQYPTTGVASTFDYLVGSSVVTSATDNFAVEMWFATWFIYTANSSSYLFNTGGTKGIAIHLDTTSEAGIVSPTNTPVTVKMDIISAGTTTIAHQTIITDTGWHHLVCERRGGVSTIYLDGVPSTTTSAAAPGAATGASSIGDQFAVNPFFGQVAHIAVYDTTLPSLQTWAQHYLYGSFAPENLSIEFDSSGIINSYSVRGAGGSNTTPNYTDALSVAAYGYRAGYVDAPDADTVTKTTAFATQALTATKNPVLRVTFDVKEPVDGWYPGQQLLITSAQHGLTKQPVTVTKVTRSYYAGTGQRAYTIEAGGNALSLGAVLKSRSSYNAQAI